MLQNSSLKEQAIADLDFMLMATSAVTSVYHWRMRRLPDTIRSHDKFGDGHMLEDWLLPTYSCRDGFREILGSEMGLRFAGRDVSHALLILIHSQLLSRPLEQFFVRKIQAEYEDEQVPRRAIAAMLQHGTEGYVQQWLDGTLPEEPFLPIATLNIPSRNMLLEVTDEDLPQLANALAESKKSMQRLLREPQMQDLMQQTYQHMQLLGYEQQDHADDPLHLRNGETIIALSHLMHTEEAQQASLNHPIDQLTPRELSETLCLIASAIRQIYGETIASKDASLMEPKRPSFGCGHLFNQTIRNMDYPHATQSPIPSVKPAYVASQLESLAGTILTYPNWEKAAESLGTYDRFGTRSMERYLQTMRPLEWASTLLEHASHCATPPLDTEAPDFLCSLHQALKGMGKQPTAERCVG